MISEHASPLAALGGVDAGGQNVHVAELSAALARQGHQVTVYTRRDDASLPAELCAPAGYRVVHVPAGPPQYLPKDELLEYMGEFGSFLTRHWQQERPGIAHAHFWMSGIATQLAAEACDIPAVQTFHALGVVKRRFQGAADTSPPCRIATERRLAHQAARVAATCTDEVFELARMGLPTTRTSVIPCGVDAAGFTPHGPLAVRGRYRRTARHRLVSVGRLVPRKGFETTIAALADLPDTELLIAGGPSQGAIADDAEAHRLLEIARGHGVAGRVRLLGQVSHTEMPALLRSADLVVCTPWYEPFGIVPLEAMACGRPVVAAAVGGMLDTVVDGVTGLLVPPREPAGLTQAISELLSSRSTRTAFGAAGRRRVRARYTWDRVATDTVRAYARTLRPAEPRRGEVQHAAAR